MKKIAVLILVIIVCFLFAACTDDTDKTIENDTDIAEEITSDSLKDSAQQGSHSSSSSGSAVKLEDITSEYVEPTFKVVSTLAECYDYFEVGATDTVTTEKNDDGKVSLITVTDKNGNIKGTMNFSYDDKILATAIYYKNGEVAEKVAFSFHNETTLNIVAHVDSESRMCFYFYNEDGSFNSYVDSSGFSALLVGNLMQGLGGALSQ